MEIVNKVEASWLFSDKGLTKKLTAAEVEKFFDRIWDSRKPEPKRPLYFYDGNNGDKHMLVGWSKDYKNHCIEWVMGVNLTQCHIASRGAYDNCFYSASEVVKHMKPIETGMDLFAVLNKVRTYNW